jgi:hypothetical protein
LIDFSRFPEKGGRKEKQRDTRVRFIVSIALAQIVASIPRARYSQHECVAIARDKEAEEYAAFDYKARRKRSTNNAHPRIERESTFRIHIKQCFLWHRENCPFRIRNAGLFAKTFTIKARSMQF